MPRPSMHAATPRADERRASIAAPACPSGSPPRQPTRIRSSGPDGPLSDSLSSPYCDYRENPRIPLRASALALPRMRASPAVPARRSLGTSSRSATPFAGVDALRRHDLGTASGCDGPKVGTLACTIAWKEASDADPWARERPALGHPTVNDVVHR